MASFGGCNPHLWSSILIVPAIKGKERQILIMIQRIQTIFLFLAAACFGVLFTAPMATSDKPTSHFLSDQVYNIQDHLALIALASVGAALAIITIFLFKNRKLQVRLGYVVMLMAILLPLVSIWLLHNDTSTADSAVQVKDQWGMFVPLGAILFEVMATYFIRKDDHLVKSMDRLR